MVKMLTKSRWNTVKVEQLAANTKHALAMGPFGSRITKDNFVDSGVPVIRGVNISNDLFDHKNLVFITETKADELAASNAFPDDLVFTHRGTLGQVGIIPWGYYPRYVVSQSQMKLTCDQTKVLPMFLYYYFRSEWGQHELLSHTGGSGVPAISSPLTTLRNATIHLPPLPTQRKIAAILSAYDELIENNTRRIAILEEMAQSLYREWFVHFRFPGHEKKKMVESPLGLIPEGWEMVKLGEVCNITMGQSPSSEYYNSRGEGLPFHQGVSDFGERFPTDRMYCSIENRIAEDGDILFSVRAPVGRINLANKKIVIGRGLCAIRSKTGNQRFVYQQLKEQFQEEDTIGNGAIFKSVTKEDMHNIKMLWPSTEIISSFEKFLESIFYVLDVITKKNANLRKTRDLLLPKLISGELDVEQLEIAGVEESEERETKAVEA